LFFFALTTCFFTDYTHSLSNWSHIAFPTFRNRKMLLPSTRIFCTYMDREFKARFCNSLVNYTRYVIRNFYPYDSSAIFSQQSNSIFSTVIHVCVDACICVFYVCSEETDLLISLEITNLFTCWEIYLLSKFAIS
jgi:hypothetical protein